MVATQAEKLTINEFIHLYETEGPFEIIDGERILLMPPVQKHTEVAHKLFTLMLLFLWNINLGTVYHENVFVIPGTDKKKWVKGSRVPDIMFYRQSRLDKYKEDYPNWGELPLMLVPDLVIEVVSENDTYSELNRKVKLYLEDGVQLVWVIDPKYRTVDNYRNNQQTNLTEKDTLSGEDIIPNFEVKISTLFEGLS